MSLFLNAKPVWVKGEENSLNYRAQFKTVFEADINKSYTLNIAAANVYSLKINGKFVAYGPARAGRGVFRIDRLDVNKNLTNGTNVIVIEVCAYNANSYAMIMQNGFLQAELLENDAPVLWTGEHFTARQNPYYIRKTQRYSFQRPFAESYIYNEVEDDFTTSFENNGDLALYETEAKTLIERNVPYPQYEKIEAEYISSGTLDFFEPETYKRDRSTKPNDKMIGYPMEELDLFQTDDAQKMKFTKGEIANINNIGEKEYIIKKFPHNATGFFRLSVNCEKPTTIYVLYDELLLGDTVDFLRMDCANALKYELCAGEHELQVFTTYTMHYVQLTVLKGKAEIKEFSMIEYKHPPVKKELKFEDEAIQKIADAALETFKQNAVDIFTDCPSRENAGWLCDSFFTARTEFCLKGKAEVEKNYLENFLHEENYIELPEGMLPMCYPADHLDGWFIPNWAMWFVLELYEYKERTNDIEFVERCKTKVYKLLKLLAEYENEDGLLNRLPGWIFIEWSEANDFVRDVSYPSNMIYYAALSATSKLYDDAELLSKAKKLRETIIEKSYNGEFFVDNSRRNDEGVFVNTDNISETCQYYAFFSKVATPEEFPELFERMMNEFGPFRDCEKVWPNVHKSAPFIGNFLRLDILNQYGYKDKVIDNIKGYFLYMAEQTGTLWEKAEPRASCNHGFASHVLYWLV